ncbi:obscurin-like [Haliotis cracherodii]|uniref:obscurin-like n=1 Tax=Haliotis cracherodii TaxID=6455 RepID=UPI0039ED6951
MKHNCLLDIPIVWVLLWRSVEGLTVIHEGGNVSLSWKQPDPPVREFSILKSGICVFNVTDFDNVTACNPRVEFTGNVTSDGAGVFSFVLRNVTLEDDGSYICSPYHRGSRIARCGEELHVLDVNATYGLHGEPLSISWNLPNPGVKEFTVMKSGECFFHITNYKEVTKCGNASGYFTGNITPSGSGVFSFDLPTLSRSDDGYFRCFAGSPSSKGPRIPACGQEVSIINDLQHPYIVGPDATQPGKGLKLACHFNIAVNSHRYHHIIASFTWRKNGVTLETGHRYNVTSVHAQWMLSLRYYISFLTMTDLSMEEDTDRYTCHAQLDHRLSTEESDAYTTEKKLSTDLYTKYTLAREGGNATIVWKMPSQGGRFRVEKPRTHALMSVIDDNVHVWRSFWSKIRITGIIVFPDSRALLLTMYNVRLRDAGHYHCGRSLCDNVLVVQKPPSKPAIHASDAAVVGGPVTLSCSSEAKSLPKKYRPRLSYIWRRHNKRLRHGGMYVMKGSHLIVNVTKKHHRGRYSCQAKEGSLASAWSDDISLDVMESPSKPIISSPVETVSVRTVKLMCLSSSFSWRRHHHPGIITYTWRRNNIKIQSGGRYDIDGPMLTITDVGKEDAGNYSCRAEERGYRSPWSDVTEVDIFGPAPHVSAHVQATPGQTVTLTCSSPARSRSRTAHVAFTWRRNNVQIESGGRYQMREGTLTITDARKEDEGTYSCRTEHDTLVSDWSETAEILIWADPSHRTAIVAGACAAVIASVAIIFVVFLLLYKRTKRSVEIRYIPADSVRMSDIDQSAIPVSDEATLIKD